jgi:hypothetical protein
MSCPGKVYLTLHLSLFLSVAQQPESGLDCTVLRFLDHTHTRARARDRTHFNYYVPTQFSHQTVALM